ncbi:hypothetical protein [Bacillus cereus group sp. BfR-BA-01330]|uniref:hypothetical protein n=1 Tax=Bacillus cereus group sp. BfR-BA-01330 TaxID=2920306 RepID=UPI001F5746B6
MREVFVPVNITYTTALEFSNELKQVSLSEDRRVVIDFRNFARGNGRLEPFGALFIINCIRGFISEMHQSGGTVSINYLSEQEIRNTYARSLRFYSSLGIPIGQTPDMDYIGSAGANFIPIMKMDISPVKKSVDEYRDIKYISRQIATVASRGNGQLFEYINYCVIEILRNVTEHSESNYLWYAAQYWSSDNCVEVCIMDEGIGIQDSLRQELGEDEENILKFSIVPGCSSKPTTHYIEHADNSGFGLYMISEMGRRNGDFIIASNGESLMFARDSENHSICMNSGTIIRIRLKIDELENYDVQREQLITEGLELAHKYNTYRERKKYAPGLPLPNLFTSQS